jgi:hypothetical protein
VDVVGIDKQAPSQVIVDDLAYLSVVGSLVIGIEVVLDIEGVELVDTGLVAPDKCSDQTCRRACLYADPHCAPIR